ncbi:MAG: hypothetical protein NTX97_13905 [Bacteroidetes bacterium]|nr:hypothetical protein [Bacteroidota bacterium]
MKTTETFQIHEEHKEWLNNLFFYKDELSIMQRRIAEIAKKYTTKDILANVEHFQNKLIIQKEQIDILSHNIKVHEESMEKEMNKDETKAKKINCSSHLDETKQLQTFEKIFKELRKELNQFLAKWM